MFSCRILALEQHAPIQLVSEDPCHDASKYPKISSSFTFSIFLLCSMVPKLPVYAGLAVLFLFSLITAVAAQNGPNNVSEFK